MDTTERPRVRPSSKGAVDSVVGRDLSTLRYDTVPEEAIVGLTVASYVVALHYRSLD